MELGRECLQLWGYKRVDELIWVKTNQLQRLIRTGRTGHWLNHSKEHCLVGVKGSPQINRNLDCDVLVAEVQLPPARGRHPQLHFKFVAKLGHRFAWLLPDLACVQCTRAALYFLTVTTDWPDHARQCEGNIGTRGCTINNTDAYVHMVVSA